MSPLLPQISPVIVLTILDLLIPILLPATGGNRDDASEAAIGALADYRPQTAEELGLAAEIIAFRFRALGLVKDSALPGVPPRVVLDLTKTANALRRNEAAAQRKLDALRRVRLAEAKQAAVPKRPAPPPAEPAAEPPPAPPSEPPSAPLRAAREMPVPEQPLGRRPANNPAVSRPAARPQPARPQSARPTFPATPAEEAKLSDEDLKNLVLNYSPGARALAAALNVPRVPAAGRRA